MNARTIMLQSAGANSALLKQMNTTYYYSIFEYVCIQILSSKKCFYYIRIHSGMWSLTPQYVVDSIIVFNLDLT